MGVWHKIGLVCLILVLFRWAPNQEPDFAFYRLFQRTGDHVVCIADNITEAEIRVDIAKIVLAQSVYFLTAVDTEGLESEPSIEYGCDDACKSKYLKPRKVMGVGLDSR